MKITFNATSSEKQCKIAHAIMHLLNTEFECDVILKGDEKIRMPHAEATSYVTIYNRAGAGE